MSIDRFGDANFFRGSGGFAENLLSVAQAPYDTDRKSKLDHALPIGRLTTREMRAVSKIVQRGEPEDNHEKLLMDQISYPPYPPEPGSEEHCARLYELNGLLRTILINTPGRQPEPGTA